MTKFLTVPSFTALAVLFPDHQNLTYVKQLNVALPFPRLGLGILFTCKIFFFQKCQNKAGLGVLSLF